VKSNAQDWLLIDVECMCRPQEDFDSFNTNVFGMLNVSKAFLPYIRQTTTGGQRTIANFGSIGSWRGFAGTALYCGTKFVRIFKSSVEQQSSPYLTCHTCALSTIQKKEI
jgi:NADP-dependent 3-hydroxy acid dehydrogenase YdfG